MLGRSLLMKAGGVVHFEPNPPFANVVLLLHGDGANGSTTIVDSSPRPKTVTPIGNAQISTAQGRFGESSIAFDTNGDYLRLDGSSEFAFSGGWTIEFWYYANGTSRFYETLFDTRASGQSTANGISIYHGGSAPFITCDTGGTGVTITGFTLNQWHHVAFSKVGTSLRAFLDGVQSGATVTHTANIIVNPNRPVIGANLALNAGLNGFFDEFRISADWGYVSNFPVPTGPFPDA